VGETRTPERVHLQGRLEMERAIAACWILQERVAGVKEVDEKEMRKSKRREGAQSLNEKECKSLLARYGAAREGAKGKKGWGVVILGGGEFSFGYLEVS